MPETNFFWDPLSDNILQERDETGAVTAEYTTEPGLYGNLISQNRQVVESQYHFDAVGSTFALTDDNQQVINTYAYAAFGEVTEHTGSTASPFQYIGQKGYFTDEVTGNCCVRRRPYRPVEGRWICADPVYRFPHAETRFSYARNRVLVRVDPTGLITVAPVCEDEKYRLGIDECAAEAAVRWNFKLEKKKHCEGFLVQHVEVRCKVSSCESCPIPDDAEIPIVAEYLEAWYVEADKDFDAGFAAIGFTDKANHTARNNFCGVYQQKGVAIKFFCLDDIGDLRTKWKKGRTYGTSKVCETGAGDLISIGQGSIGDPNDDLPDWWSKPGEEKAGKRDFSLKWTCCKCKPKTVSPKATPDPRDKDCEKAQPTK